VTITMNTIKSLPSYAKVIIALFPGVLLSIIIVVYVIMPKQKEIKALEVRIDKQNSRIAASLTKVAKLDSLIRENEILLARVNELKEQLPEEKEISSLLKQVSDLGIGAGLEIKYWKPSPKRVHSSKIVYEIPVSVQVTGSYHNFGYFLSSLTRLNRIVNVTNMKLDMAKKNKGDDMLSITFTASTFSAIPEAELARIAKKKKKGRR